MKTRVNANAGNNTPKVGVKKPALKAKKTAKPTVKPPVAKTAKAPVAKTATPAKQRAVVETPKKRGAAQANTKKQPATKKGAAAKGKTAAKKTVLTNVDDEENQEESEVEKEVEKNEEMDEEEQEEDDDKDIGDDDEEEEAEDEEEDVDEEMEDDAEDEGDEENEEVADNNETESDNDAPEEAPAKANKVADESTFEKKQHFSTDPPAESVPEENLVYIKNAPQKTKILMVFHVFKSCGIISNIYKNTTETGTQITIAFECKDSAINAMLFLKSFQLKGVGELALTSNTITEKLLNELSENTIIIRNIKPNLSLEEIKKTFSDCGTILYASFIPSRHPAHMTASHNATKSEGYGKTVALTYKNKDGAECALDKHNSVLAERHIWVTMKNKIPIEFPECTIKLANTKNYTTFSAATLESIFADCGEIYYIEILCSKELLATITFAKKESVEKAMALNNKTVEDLLINITPINIESRETAIGPEKTSVYVYGLRPGTTEKDLRDLFEQVVSGIKFIKIINKSATIEFDTVDNYCQAFKLDEAKLNGQIIYVEPLSNDKFQRTLRRQQAQPKTLEHGKRNFAAIADHANNPVQYTSFGPSANKRPRNNFAPRNNFQRNQNGGFQPRNNFQSKPNGFAPRNNFQGNGNRFPPRNQQAGDANNFQGGPQAQRFFKNNFNQPAQNGMRQQNSFNRNPGGPKKFNKNKPNAAKNFNKNPPANA